MKQNQKAEVPTATNWDHLNLPGQLHPALMVIKIEKRSEKSIVRFRMMKAGNAVRHVGILRVRIIAIK